MDSALKSHYRITLASLSSKQTQESAKDLYLWSNPGSPVVAYKRWCERPVVRFNAKTRTRSVDTTMPAPQPGNHIRDGQE